MSNTQAETSAVSQELQPENAKATYADSVGEDHQDAIDWHLLLTRIESRRCTPFIGGEACFGMQQLRAKVLHTWANDEEDFPFDSTDDFPRAAQFVADKHDPSYPKERVALALEETAKSAGPSDAHEPHRVLASLPFPVYITTNFHDQMERALREQEKDPMTEYCRWNEKLKEPPSILEQPSSYGPDVANPLVFHLYGRMDVPGSMVLTEDDYFDFLMNLSEDPQLVPMRLHKYFISNSLLFVGYRVFDWDFRIVFRTASRYSKIEPSRRFLVAVQIEPMEGAASAEERQRFRRYFERRFERFAIQVHWGRCQEFAGELERRWAKWEQKKSITG